jgi:hypothetical protein
VQSPFVDHQGTLARIENGMFDAAFIPCINNVYQFIGSLDHGGIGIFAHSILQRQSHAPILSIMGYRYIVTACARWRRESCPLQLDLGKSNLSER